MQSFGRLCIFLCLLYWDCYVSLSALIFKYVKEFKEICMKKIVPRAMFTDPCICFIYVCQSIQNDVYIKTKEDLSNVYTILPCNK